MTDLFALLRGNPYPGRGLCLGAGEDGETSILVYFIMGRSENSRNRIFVETEDGIRTKAYDEGKVEDPSLILYHPVRRLKGNMVIVGNGDHSDTIRDAIAQGHCYRHGLLTRTFEPDAPHHTPRIAGVLKPNGSYNLAILKRVEGECCQRSFFEYDRPLPGMGHFLSTYETDGQPLPSFRGEPRPVCLEDGGVESLARALWEAMDRENKVSLYVAELQRKTGQWRSVILNRHEEEKR